MPSSLSATHSEEEEIQGKPLRMDFLNWYIMISVPPVQKDCCRPKPLRAALKALNRMTWARLSVRLGPLAAFTHPVQKAATDRTQIKSHINFWLRLLARFSGHHKKAFVRHSQKALLSGNVNKWIACVYTVLKREEERENKNSLPLDVKKPISQECAPWIPKANAVSAPAKHHQMNPTWVAQFFITKISAAHHVGCALQGWNKLNDDLSGRKKSVLHPPSITSRRR